MAQTGGRTPIEAIAQAASYAALVHWIAEGKVTPTIAATYALDQLADADRASETGRTVGKIAVVME